MLPCLEIVLKDTFLSYFLRHIASFLSMFKLLVIGLIIIGRDPFALFGMQAPGIWEWGQGNKVRFPGIIEVIKALSPWKSTVVFTLNSVLEGGVSVMHIIQEQGWLRF